MSLGTGNTVTANIGYSVAQLVYRMTLQLQEEFLVRPSSPTNLNANSYTSKLAVVKRSAKLVLTRPQSTDVFV